MPEPGEIANDEAVIRAKLNGETAKIGWRELQRYFAAGQTLSVALKLDLIDVAFAFEQDDSQRVKGWLQDDLLAPVSDRQARRWFEQDRLVWALVVKPWVLVQDPD